MRSRVIGLVCVLSALAALAGCGDDDEPARSGQPAPSATGSAGSPGSPGSSGSTPAEPEVTPATGDLVELESLSFHLTAGRWIGSRVGISVSMAQEIEGRIDLFRIGAGDVPLTQPDFEEVREITIRGNRQTDPYLKPAADRVVNNVTVWVFTGQKGDHTFYEVGGLHNDHTMKITFEWPTDWVEGPQRVEEVLASVVWR